jgi:putative endonuclease
LSSACGRKGERLAACFLERHGYEVLARNWHCSLGEIDIVAREGDTLVFVEVRSRRAGTPYKPEESISATKMARLAAVAEAFLATHPWNGPCRFDVVAVQLRPAGADIRLLRAAFTPEA